MKNLFTLLGLVFALASFGQDFVSNTRHLFFESNTKYAGRTILDVVGRNGDTLLLKYYALEVDVVKYSYINKRLYKEDSLLFFDFGAAEGDTVVYKNLGKTTKIRVDSIRNITLKNGIAYTHFFAHHTVNGTSYTIIKGLGEKRTALELFHLNTSPLLPFVVSACRNDSLIYWDTYGETLTTYGRDVDTTCDYDRFEIEGSIGEQTYFPYKMYPNPSQTTLTIGDLPAKAKCSIFSLQGKKYLEEKYVKEIDVSTFPRGLYIVEIKVSDKIYRTKFVKD